MANSSSDDEFYDAREGWTDEEGDNEMLKSPSDSKSIIEERFVASMEDLNISDIGELELPPPAEAEKVLDEDLDELRLVVKHFLNGEFLKAELLMKPKYRKSLYSKFLLWLRFINAVSSYARICNTYVFESLHDI